MMQSGFRSKRPICFVHRFPPKGDLIDTRTFLGSGRVSSGLANVFILRMSTSMLSCSAKPKQ